MDIYVVTRHGVYLRGIVGIYSTQALADEAMKKAKDSEPDDYHEFEVNHETLDAPVSGLHISLSYRNRL